MSITHLLLVDRHISAACDDPVDQSVFPSFLCRHEVVPFGICLNPFNRLSGGISQNPVQFVFYPQNLLGPDLDIGGLPAEAPNG